MGEQRRRVLLVEDETALVATLRDDLEESGFDVEMAITGEEALRKVDYRPPDFVLLDLHLSGAVDGVTVLARLKQADRTRAIPVVVLSDVGDEDRMREALDLGADAYFLRTRYNLSDLLERMHLLLKEASVRS